MINWIKDFIFGPKLTFQIGDQLIQKKNVYTLSWVVTEVDSKEYKLSASGALGSAGVWLSHKYVEEHFEKVS